jgi:hypothetical protein
MSCRIPERVAAHDPLQLADQLAGKAAAQVGLDPVFDDVQPDALEPLGLGAGELLVGEVL